MPQTGQTYLVLREAGLVVGWATVSGHGTPSWAANYVSSWKTLSSVRTAWLC